MNGKSEDILKGKIKELKKLFPEAITEGKVDFEQLKATLGSELNTDNERYVLNWAGKSEAFRVLQQPTTATLAPAPKESVNFDTTENIFIEGENLEVLKVLQKSYYGKIKMIYIDPPYNTGNDSFIYPDKFAESKEEYLKRIGEKDEEGYLLKEGLFRKNSKENGQFHSVWLSMMYPRLFLARNLLRDDGVIFISIDDNEVHNLRMVMNEIFGEENYRNSIILKRGMKSVQRQFETIDKLGSGYETIFMYSKNSDYRFPRFEIERDDEPIGSWNNHWRGSDRPTMRYDIFGVKPKIGQWRWSESRSKVAIDNYKNMLKDLKKTENNITQEEIDKWYLKQEDESIDLLRLSKNKKPEHYISPSETRLSNDIFFDIPPNSTSTLKNLFEGKVFNNPKPLELIKRLVALSNSENELVLDFFSGSCTTAHAILELNIEKQLNTKFICVQIPEKCDENSDAFKKDLKTISEIGKERIRKVINELKRELKENEGLFKVDKIDLGLRVFKLKDSNFKVWRSDVIEGKEDLGKQLDMFQNPVKPGAEMNNMMWELLVKSGYELTTKVEEREITKCPVQIIAEGELVICLSKLTDTAVKEILKLKPKKVICLDSLFEKNDKLKTNTALQMKDAGVEFKTI